MRVLSLSGVVDFFLLSQICQIVALQCCCGARIVSWCVGWEPSGLLSWVLSSPIWVLLLSSYTQASAEATPRMYQPREVMQPISRSVTASAMISWCCEAWNSICFLCYSYQMVCPSYCSRGMINNCISWTGISKKVLLVEPKPINTKFNQQWHIKL